MFEAGCGLARSLGAWSPVLVLACGTQCGDGGGGGGVVWLSHAVYAGRAAPHVPVQSSFGTG